MQLMATVIRDLERAELQAKVRRCAGTLWLRHDDPIEHHPYLLTEAKAFRRWCLFCSCRLEMEQRPCMTPSEEV